MSHLADLDWVTNLLVTHCMLRVQAIWPHVIERHGGEVDAKFDYSTLAHISEGYSSGTIDQVIHG